ncbi:MAG: response regulator transcription factor [Gammaproteobacteria bacterium]|uniref:response regulator transcription factor n=1 Tax=Pseudomaricurvus alcaniphilus TaxID=1166482 RepID=UPI00140E062D|nr:response regulator transcription factor [Pseudomaricurvus alcaniphilus]MBR9910133.1 response regulator transcription factor [Gammaproteobacteria bacterium]NHN36650.1 response regulator transcription factor [Pseudomaricurvus alcaniphilus]
MLNLLLIEDDLDLAATIVDYLELEAINCDHAANGVAGLALIQKHTYQAIILDINLPRLNGLDVCTAMRAAGIDTPVIMLTARDSLANKLEGFESGADDYLVKPFAMEELIARAQALAKRRSGQVERLQVADLRVDVREKKAFRQGRPLKLSPTAFRILEVLARHSPAPVSRELLMQLVWGDDPPDSNSLKVHLFNLRKQVDADGAPALIHTLSGVGFALRE